MRELMASDINQWPGDGLAADNGIHYRANMHAEKERRRLRGVALLCR
jgi:hypothetical protein